MNAVEIEEAVSNLAAQPFDAGEFPFALLEAFGNKATTLKRLRSGNTNRSDQEGGLLQTNNIHLKVCAPGAVTSTLTQLRASPATRRAKAKFILATDGLDLEAEDLLSGDTVACAYADFPDHFGFFLPLAGISTVRQIRESAFDIKATGRLNRLYVQLLKDNPEWAGEERRHDMNVFLARLIFCFFAEDTDIFAKPNLFTDTVADMSGPDGTDARRTNTHAVIGEIFRAMNLQAEERRGSGLPRWADGFPYVNGGLFSGSPEVPQFGKAARSYFLHIGHLDWKQINPDIFGSMIQAVTDREERGRLGLHYTSVPNILKVLNPLFLDDLRGKLTEAGDNVRKLLNLRRRLGRIRVFDPACGSGNFLVIAYRELRGIEAEINTRRGEAGRCTDIPLTNFRGLELRDFSAEIARLALIIAKYQCDVVHRGQKEALAALLPLDAQNWITCANALRLDWLSVCPPLGTSVEMHTDDLLTTPEDQAGIDFENAGGETYICGNPPYLGSQWQSREQKEDLKAVFEGRTKLWKSLDYVTGWFMKAADYGTHIPSSTAFVATNSICQGRQVPTLWPAIFATNHEITFAHTSFKWANLASHNAGVVVVIVGISGRAGPGRRLYVPDGKGKTLVRACDNINAYLVAGPDIRIAKRTKPLGPVSGMSFGSMPNEGGLLLLSRSEAKEAIEKHGVKRKFIRPFLGSQEFIKGLQRHCVWVKDNEYQEAKNNAWLNGRFELVRKQRTASNRATTRKLANTPFRFGEVRQSGDETVIIVPGVSSENRPYLPVGLLDKGNIVSNLAFALYDAPLWNLALIASRLHWVWIGAVCGKLGTGFRYSNTLGWNTFPVPFLTEKNRTDLTRCAIDILLAREAHFPDTIAELYEPDNMPANLRAAHDFNDEKVERIFIGRRFKNDSERLEKLFTMYTKMTAKAGAA